MDKVHPLLERELGELTLKLTRCNAVWHGELLEDGQVIWTSRSEQNRDLVEKAAANFADYAHTKVSTDITHAKYQVLLPGHTFPGYRSLEREKIAFLANGGTDPGEKKIADPEFWIRIDQLIADLKDGKCIKIGPAIVTGISEEEYNSNH